MSNSETAFQPTIDDLKDFFKHKAQFYAMKRRNTGSCPLYWYLQDRGVQVEYVSIASYCVRDDNDVLDYMPLDNKLCQFVREIDNHGVYNELISAQECLDILDRM